MDEFADPASVDLVTLAQPVALMFRDASDLSQVTDGIEVTVHDSKLPLTKRNLQVVPSGWWTTPRLPGFAGWPSDRDRSFVASCCVLCLSQQPEIPVWRARIEPQCRLHLRNGF